MFSKKLFMVILAGMAMTTGLFAADNRPANQEKLDPYTYVAGDPAFLGGVYPLKKVYFDSNGIKKEAIVSVTMSFKFPLEYKVSEDVTRKILIPQEAERKILMRIVGTDGRVVLAPARIYVLTPISQDSIRISLNELPPNFKVAHVYIKATFTSKSGLFDDVTKDLIIYGENNSPSQPVQIPDDVAPAGAPATVPPATDLH